MLDLEKEEVVLKEVPRQRVVSRREKGIYQEIILCMIGELMGGGFCPKDQQARVKCIGPPMSIYYDDEFKENDADIEVALPISGNITVGPEFEVKMLDEGRVVSYIHKGPYQEVGEAYRCENLLIYWGLGTTWGTILCFLHSILKTNYLYSFNFHNNNNNNNGGNKNETIQNYWNYS